MFIFDSGSAFGNTGVTGCSLFFFFFFRKSKNINSARPTASEKELLGSFYTGVTKIMSSENILAKLILHGGDAVGCKVFHLVNSQGF